MIPHPIWQPSFERGLVHLRAGAMDEALKAFDEAYMLSDGAARPFRSRPSVLESLESIESACTRPTAEVATGRAESPDGRRFAMLGALPLRVQAAVLVLDLVQPTKRTSSLDLDLDAFAQSHLSILRASRNLIDFLPPEMLTIIGRLAVEDAGSSDAAFTLAAVSRRWRAVFLADSYVWGAVHLDGLSRQGAVIKLDACLALGPIRQLGFKFSRSRSEVEFLATVDGRLSSLRSLVVDGARNPMLEILALVHISDNIEDLVVTRPFRHKQCDQRPFRLPEPLLSIRRLEIRCVSNATRSGREGEDVSIAWMLPLLPNLEELVIAHPKYELFQPGGGTEIGTAPRLSTLVISRGSSRPPRDVFSQSLALPSLRVLDLGTSTVELYIPYLFPPAPHPPNTQHLTHLLLPHLEADEGILIDCLSDLAGLLHLDVRGIKAPFELIQALVHPPPGAPGSRHLPRLQILELNGECAESDDEGFMREVNEAACRLVMSRGNGALEVVEWLGEHVSVCWDYARAIAMEWSEKRHPMKEERGCRYSSSEEEGDDDLIQLSPPHSSA